MKKESIVYTYWVRSITKYWWCLFAIFIGFVACTQKKQVSKDTFADPKRVLINTKAVLDTVAKHLNAGKKELRYLREIERAKNQFIK